MLPIDSENTVPFDPEIERTFHRRRREQSTRKSESENMENNNENLNGNGNQNQLRAMNEFAVPLLNGLQSSIKRPAIEANNFELKHGWIQLLQSVGLFSGSITEDPNSHILTFLEICDTFKMNGVSEDAIRLRFFPFSLKDGAKIWLKSLPAESILTWNDLAQKFLTRYFPPTKTAKLRNDITSFTQFDGETLFEAWERFKELLRKCPHHGLPEWMQIQTFYNGLSGHTRTSIDAAAGGALMSKNFSEGYDLLEKMASNNYQWPSERVNPRKVAEISDSNAINLLTVQVARLAEKIDGMGLISKVQAVQGTEALPGCELCGEAHMYDNCPLNQASANYVGNYNRNNNPYSTTYNPGWRNHPNFSWSQPGTSQQPQQPQQPHQPQQPQYRPSPQQNFNNPNPPPGFQNQIRPPPVEKKSNLESLMEQYIISNNAAIRNLETQVGQLANALNNRAQGSLPGSTDPNPRPENIEQCKAIVTQNLEETTTATEKSGVEQKDSSSGSEPKKAPLRPPPPFPRRLQKPKQEGQFQKFLDVLKQLHINIPLVDALEQMPGYAKFMKDILSKKRRLAEFETISLTEECSAILQNKLPPKLKDPGSFTIPCTIGNLSIGKALCDLGASINLMPLSIYKKLGLGEPRPTTVTLQLADRSLTHPLGVINDVLVKVDKFIFPADFIILDYEEDRDIPIILGRPFLATGRTLIDVEKGELTMRVQDEQVTFKVFKEINSYNNLEGCFALDVAKNSRKGEIKKDIIREKPVKDDHMEESLEGLNILFDESNNENFESVKPCMKNKKVGLSSEGKRIGQQKVGNKVRKRRKFSNPLNASFFKIVEIGKIEKRPTKWNRRGPDKECVLTDQHKISAHEKKNSTLDQEKWSCQKVTSRNPN